MSKTGKVVTNGGSAIGEAIGTHMEKVLQTLFLEEVEKYNCHFLSQMGYNPNTRKTSKKLLLCDEFGTEYNIDGVITNEKVQPLVLIESKYIRYKKHNRDKGSWICHAHSAIKRRYTSVRSSIAVLAGNWSGTSLKMLEQSDVTIFLIGFDCIASILAKKGIDFYWEENDYNKAQIAWSKYNALSEEDKMAIAEAMVDTIKEPLITYLDQILSVDHPSYVKKVYVELMADTGEIKRLCFDNLTDAINFLEDFSIEEVFDVTSFYTIYDVYEES